MELLRLINLDFLVGTTDFYDSGCSDDIRAQRGMNQAIYGIATYKLNHI